MSKEFGAKLSADTLIALKVQDIAADYIAKNCDAAGFDVDASKFIAMRVQDITPRIRRPKWPKATGETKTLRGRLIRDEGPRTSPPDYIAQNACRGLRCRSRQTHCHAGAGHHARVCRRHGQGRLSAKPTVDQLIALKVQERDCPEYAAKLHADGIEASSFDRPHQVPHLQRLP